MSRQAEPAARRRRRPMRPVLLRLVAPLAIAALSACDIGGGGGGGGSPPDDQSFLPLEQIDGAQFTATRLSLVEGEGTTLVWDIPGGSGTAITGLGGEIGARGERDVAPAVTTEYVLTTRVEGQDGLYGRALTVQVVPAAAVTLQANVVSGEAPLPVRFTPVVASTTNITRYYYDFEGDGGEIDGGLGVGADGFDTLNIRSGGFTLREFDTIGRPLTHVYRQAGTYTARVRVWDDAGNQADADVTIEVRNAPPEVIRLSTASRQSSGTAPLRVSFQISATDADGIESVQWDFDGDGTFDETSPTRIIQGVFRSEATHTYESPGVFEPIVRLTDTTGLSTDARSVALTVMVSDEAVPTIASIGALAGAAPFAANLTVSVSDPGRSGLSTLRVDYDGDGVVEDTPALPRNGGTVTLEHVYEEPGSYVLTIELVANDGTRATRYVEVVVEAAHALSVSPNAADPLAPGADDAPITIRLTLGGTTEGELVVVDTAGRTVRRIAPRERRESGDYAFEWDGRGDDGRLVAADLYHAVLKYTVGDESRVLDARDTHEATNYYPSINVPSALLRDGIEPFNEQPAVYPFVLDRFGINRLTAYITRRGSGVLESASSLFRARHFTDGEQQILWYGDGFNGKFLPTVEQAEAYVPGVIAESVAPNAMLLTHRPTIADPDVDVPIFDPLDASGSTISFDLSHAATVQLRVNSTDSGAEVLRRDYLDLDAGRARIRWDGQDNAGRLLGPGGYRLQLTAMDPYGSRSIDAQVMQRIRY